MTNRQAPPAQEAVAASSALVLEVVAGNASGQTIAVDDQLMIGRHVPGLGHLADDVELSRQHARVGRGQDGRYVIEDLGSTNGTFVNNERIAAVHLLALGDTIAVGSTSLVVKSVPAAPTPAVQPTTSRQVPASAGAVNVQVSIDFDSREARLSIDPGGSFRLVPGDGQWRLETDQ